MTPESGGCPPAGSSLKETIQDWREASRRAALGGIVHPERLLQHVTGRLKSLQEARRLMLAAPAAMRWRKIVKPGGG